MRGHVSHRSGRDVDLLYIGCDDSWQLHPSKPGLLRSGYRLDYDRTGRCGALTFDRRANVQLVLALLKQRKNAVEKIFVEPYIKRWLLAEARRLGLNQRAKNRLRQSLRFSGKHMTHANHLHVRFVK